MRYSASRSALFGATFKTRLSSLRSNFQDQAQLTTQGIRESFQHIVFGRLQSEKLHWRLTTRASQLSSEKEYILRFVLIPHLMVPLVQFLDWFLEDFTRIV